jgi:hypothetical protein
MLLAWQRVPRAHGSKRRPPLLKHAKTKFRKLDLLPVTLLHLKETVGTAVDKSMSRHAKA